MNKNSAEFSKAASRLTVTNVFFTALLYSLKITPRDDLPAPAGTDGVNLYYNPARFADEFTAPERVYVLVHELLHVILFHPMRRGARHAEIWNDACDYAVNLICTEYGFTTPPSAMIDQQYVNMTAEQIYDKLMQDPNNQPQSGSGEGGDKVRVRGSLTGDVMDYDPAQNGGISKAEAERTTAINTEKAFQAAKAAGDKSANLRRIMGEAQVQREPWYHYLRRYMTTLNARNYNWNRINARRAVLFGIVSPSQKSEQMGDLVIGVDCSASITAVQLSAMGAHISDLLKDVTPQSVTVLYFDSTVCHAETFTGPDYHVTLEPHGGGGTCFEPVFAYVEEHINNPQLVMMFTDLYGSFPPSFGKCDTLWVSQTEDHSVPFGELVYGDLNEG